MPDKASMIGRGSEWHRWEPHIHAPGTALNDQFGDDDEIWDRYLATIEASNPKIEVIGVTDLNRPGFTGDL